MPRTIAATRAALGRVGSHVVSGGRGNVNALRIASAACIVGLLGVSAAMAGTDVKVNGDIGIDLQNEVNLARDPANGQHLVAIYHTDIDKSAGTVPFDVGPGLGVSYTNDGGASWNSTVTPTVWGFDFDPCVAIGTTGTVFAGSVGSTTTYSYPQADTGVFVRGSHDGGASWSSATTVEAFQGGGVTTVPYDDKTMMACDQSAPSPYSGRLYVTWQRDATDWTHSEIYTAFSNDLAVSFSAPVKVNDLPTGASLANAAEPAVSPDGTVAVAWIDTNQPQTGVIPGQIMFDRSADGGVTWGTDVTVTTMMRVAKNPDFGGPYGSWRANSFPALAIDPSDGRYAYIVYTGDPDGPSPLGPDDGDIHLMRSADSGATWSGPVRVNDDVGTNGQFDPWVSVNPSGTVSVAWYDRRLDVGDIHLDVYLATSTDRGVTFSANQRVNDTQIVLAQDLVIGSDDNAWFGEYLGLDSDATNAYLAWTDTRNGERDIYFDSVAFGAPGGDTTPPVTTLTTVPPAPDGENGWYQTAPGIALSANEPAVISYRWDASGLGWSAYTTTLTALEGTDTLRYWATDAAGNTETVNASCFAVDTTAPAGSMQIAGGAASTTTTVVTVDSSVNDTTSGVNLMRVDPGGGWGAWRAYQASVPATLPASTPDGTRTVNAEVKDTAGNVLALSDTIVLRRSSTTQTIAPPSGSVLAYNARVTLAGTLITTSTLNATATITAQSSGNGVTWSNAATATVVTVTAGAPMRRAPGEYLHQVVAYPRVPSNSWFRFMFHGDETHEPTVSAKVLVKARAWLSRPVTPPTVRRGRAFAIYGYLRPYHPGKTRLYLYRRVGRGWVLYRQVLAPNLRYSTYTRYYLRYALPTGGAWYVRAYHADSTHAPTYSAIRSFVVR